MPNRAKDARYTDVFQLDVVYTTEGLAHVDVHRETERHPEDALLPTNIVGKKSSLVATTCPLRYSLVALDADAKNLGLGWSLSELLRQTAQTAINLFVELQKERPMKKGRKVKKKLQRKSA